MFKQKVVWQKTKVLAKLLPKKAGNKSSKSFQVFVSITLSAATAPEFDTILEDHWKECRRQIALARIGIFSSSKLAVNFEPTKNHPFQLCTVFLIWHGCKKSATAGGHFADTLPLFVPICLKNCLTQLMITSRQFLPHLLLYFLVISSRMCSCCYWGKVGP